LCASPHFVSAPINQHLDKDPDKASPTVLSRRFDTVDIVTGRIEPAP